jgi:hypothetical protein
MRDALKAFVLLAAGLAVFAFAAPQASAASAGTAAPTLKQLLAGEATSSLVKEARYAFRRCLRRNRVCRRRFGVGRDYRRCMRRGRCFWYWRRGCVRANRVCRSRWGIGRDYRRCMRIRRCL